MPTPEEWLEYYYPYLVDESDPRYVPGADVDTALQVAIDYRPTCLSVDRQNQAQAHMAAAILEYRSRQMRLGGTAGFSVAGTIAAAGPVTRRREGDVEVEFATVTGSTGSVSAAERNTNTGPIAPYAAFMNLWLQCVPADTAGPGQGPAGVVPIRRGAIITRRGWPKP